MLRKFLEMCTLRSQGTPSQYITHLRNPLTWKTVADYNLWFCVSRNFPWSYRTFKVIIYPFDQNRTNLHLQVVTFSDFQFDVKRNRRNIGRKYRTFRFVKLSRSKLNKIRSFSIIFHPYILLSETLIFVEYICWTQIDVQPLIDVQSSNPCPISTSHTSVPQIYVLFQILKSASNS
jgi:hypothetical protein